MNRRYTDAQILWLRHNATAKVWKNRNELLRALNKKFKAQITRSQFNNLLLYYDIKPTTTQTESVFTSEQKNWLIENAKSGNFKDCKHLTKVYNAVFNQCRTQDNIYSNLSRWDVPLLSNFNKGKYTKVQDQWLIDNFETYKDYDILAEKFNIKFDAQKTKHSISHRCTRKLGLKREPTQFKKGETVNAKPIGTISHRNRGTFIKVNDNNDKSAWIPLKKYTWEKTHGKVPEGYCIVALDRNKDNVDENNLYLIYRRGTATMAKYGWWTDNRIITANGCRWVNLYYTAKDKGAL